MPNKHSSDSYVKIQGKSLVVGEWDLRPSLVWKNGSWVEWVRVKESSEFSKVPIHNLNIKLLVVLKKGQRIIYFNANISVTVRVILH